MSERAAHNMLVTIAFVVIIVNAVLAVYLWDWHSFCGWIVAAWYARCYIGLEDALLDHFERLGVK